MKIASYSLTLILRDYLTLVLNYFQHYLKNIVIWESDQYRNNKGSLQRWELLRFFNDVSS